ncbi:sortase domain-containing protein [Acidipropionibacterium timonense]|uniref:sortase domain-containing protein n=1 Tax=Acidipropionibacterium timonense TaxID=2161818 RepID=UPI00102F960B|nr:sortase [Acidipropionibacterium timonense]
MSRRPSAFGWTFVVLLVLVLAGGAWAGWTWWGSTLVPGSRGPREADAAVASWSASPAPSPTTSSVPTPTDGTVMAVLRIPALGDSWRWPVVASTDDADAALDHALAWYRGTAGAGQVGNFAVAGRAATGADAFAELRRLRKGDDIVVQAPGVTYTYVVDVPASALTVGKDASWVLDPVPGHRGAIPTQAVITLTTSQDRVATDARAVLMGHLVATRANR